MNETVVREEFSRLKKSLYFNAAYLGPSPKRALRRAEEALVIEGDPSYFGHEQWKPLPDKLRVQIAGLLGGNSENVSHHTSVCEVISLIAAGYSFRQGDVVIAFDGEYPSDVLPWMLHEKNKGYELRLLPIDSLMNDDFIDKLPAKTKVINFSNVSFNTGRRLKLMPLLKQLKEKEIFTVIDGTQSFGGLKLESEVLPYIDCFTCATYKWLLGSYGHAFAYWTDEALRKVERQQANWQVALTCQGANRITDCTLETLPGARKFDRGETANMINMSMLSGSFDFLNEVGLEAIEAHNQKLVRQFLKDLSREKFEVLTPEEYRGNIVCLKAKGVDSLKLESELRKNNIDTSVREGNLRLSFHLYNTSEQVNTLLQVLSSL